MGKEKEGFNLGTVCCVVYQKYRGTKGTQLLARLRYSTYQELSKFAHASKIIEFSFLL